VRVLGVVPTSRGSKYVEFLVRIEGCHQEPCQLEFGVVANADEDALRREIDAQLHNHLAAIA
jgi:hypothetical protein